MSISSDIIYLPQAIRTFIIEIKAFIIEIKAAQNLSRKNDYLTHKPK
jgi:hypothetical protein